MLPIEVKAGHVTKAKSLEKFIDKYQPVKSIILSARKPSTSRSKKVYHVPLYLAEKVMGR